MSDTDQVVEFLLSSSMKARLADTPVFYFGNILLNLQDLPTDPETLNLTPLAVSLANCVASNPTS